MRSLARLVPCLVVLLACSSAATEPNATSAEALDEDLADGTPTRTTCTSSFGHALSTAHGRLDGYLVSIVPTKTKSCNGDSGHLHLQIRANGSVYDAAVNLDALVAETTRPHAAWSEGWHPNVALDYPSDLDLHSSDFHASSRASLEAELAQVNHISVFATGYNASGVHLVHRRSGKRDGALVLDPLGSPRVVAFRFADDSF